MLTLIKNMEVRPALPADRPAIIELLRQSLGDSTIPKSEELWIWKHEQNPFGESFVLVAEENHQLIGVRAFMQWEWQWKGTTYKAIRAVDTATHPQHQGKGIFRKLTLQQADMCRRQGINFIFNTPNAQSKPGYLKMGWNVQDTMPLKMALLKPLSMVYSYFSKNKVVRDTNDPTPFQKWTHNVFDLAGHYVHNTKQFTTLLSPPFISWRYGNNPLFRYHYFTDFENYLLIGRIKQHSFAKELRLVDFILLNPKVNARLVNKAIAQSVFAYTQANDIGFISFSGQQYRRYRSFFTWMGMLPVLKLGPIITIRDLNMHDLFPALEATHNWCYSIGDMELF
jgi:predicted N-acetyltransferase YhbS